MTFSRPESRQFADPYETFPALALFSCCSVATFFILVEHSIGQIGAWKSIHRAVRAAYVN